MKKPNCSHYWRTDGDKVDFVSPDDREVSTCENPNYCPYCGAAYEAGVKKGDAR